MTERAKEPGQIAHQAWRDYYMESPDAKGGVWAAVEAACRASALEEAAKACENHWWGRDVSWWLHATKKEVSKVAAEECARSIRALIPSPAQEPRE